MTEGEKTRLVAWGRELRAVHGRLREALDTVRDAAGADAGEATRDLLLFCHGFCAALTGHHEGEDRLLFPAIAAEHPELGDTLAQLSRDHSMIGHLVGGLEAAVAGQRGPQELERHLDGIGAIMESHFRYEERALKTVLGTLTLDAGRGAVLGPLWDGRRTTPGSRPTS